MTEKLFWCDDYEFSQAERSWIQVSCIVSNNFNKSLIDVL